MDVSFDVTIALMCDRFHRLPSEILAEDAASMLRVWALLGTIDPMRGEQRHG